MKNDVIKHPIKASKLKFASAEATNTRLMGVVGVVTYWTDESERVIAQIFHLDYEKYGIDGFYHLIEPVEKEFKALILNVTGGLGGQFVSISFRELVYLLKTAFNVDPTCVEAHADFEAYLETFMSWKSDLSDLEIIELFESLTPEISGPFHAINYLVMRLVGCDPVSTMALWENPEQFKKANFFDAPYTLIKNTCHLLHSTAVNETYKVEALVDYETKYKLKVFEITLNRETYKILEIEYLEELMITSIEAAFNLNKPEHIIVSQVKDAFYERRFAENNPEMMKQSYHQGQLYIQFNKHNQHVALNPYYLNGDIYALYFFTKSGQLLIASFSPDVLMAIDKDLEESAAYDESLQFVCELKTDDPVLYAFINSEFENIFDYLGQ